MVMPLNARSVSNQSVCGSVGEKQNVQMQLWDLAHSHHVSHEIKQRNHSLRSRDDLFSYLQPYVRTSCLMVIVRQSEMKIT